jgi:outer membrane protein assembly complex protein YaeT
MSEMTETGDAENRAARGRWLPMLAVAFILAFAVPAASQEGRSESPAEAPSRPALTGSEVRFQGNDDMSARQLREAAAYELARFQEMGYRPADVDDAAYQMELEYKGRGYAFAAVDYRYEIVGDQAVVTFAIEEGPRVEIDDIVINGNRAFSAGELRAFFLEDQEGPLGAGPTYYIRSEVEDAVSDIRDLYYQGGFMEARVTDPEVRFSADREEVDISVAIVEGEQYRIREITFTGDLSPEVRQELAAVERQMVAEPYNIRQTLELRSRISEIYANFGYPEAEIDVRVSQQEKPSQVTLTAEILSGPRVRISALEITGDRRTNKSFIESRLALQAGDFYSAKAQRQSFRTLYQTGLYSRVDFSLVEGPDPRHRILRVEVEEVASRELSVEAGWGSYELLRLRLGFQEKNLFGTGRAFRTELGGSAKGADLTSNLIDPWFLRTDIRANLPVFFNYRKEPSFTRREVGTSLLFSKELGENLGLTLGYSYRNTTLTDIDLDATLEDFEKNYNLASLRSRLSYDTRNDIFFPTEGQDSHVTGEVADTVLGSEIAFFRFTTGTSHYSSLGKSTVLAFRYDTGFLIPSRGQATIPLGERFFNGGEDTVRSFGQDELGPKDAGGEPIGGAAFNVLSAELRQQLRGPLIGTLFVDYGNISPNKEVVFGTSASELTTETFRQYFRDMRPAVGAGLQYLLPLGPARLDAAYNPAARENEDAYTIHFSVGMAF